MDEKIFNLLETMYSDLTGKMDKLTSRMDSMEDYIQNNVATKHDMVRLENKMDVNRLI